LKILKELGITEDQLRRLLIGNKKRRPRLLKHRISDNVFKIGVVSDTHLCSKKEKLDELLTFYSICKKVGVSIVLHAGDILDGIKCYRGHEQEVHTFGAKEQVRYAINRYPFVEGIITHFIDGNHDESFWKLAGICTGELISNERPDLVYMGLYSADIEIGGVKIRLHHGDGGGSYALSYKGQKLAEQIPSGDKPRILLIGHYHTCFYFFYRNIHIFNCGSFQGQTSYLLRRGLNPAIGGWILEVRTGNEKNDILSITPSWIPFF
jgi:predicted phosphodiesterase